MVEIAWSEVCENLEVVASLQSLIDPGIPISPSASGVHGITNAMVEHEPTIEEFMEMNKYPLAEGEIILIAHNAPFDRRYFAPHIGNLKGTICTLKLARKIYPDSPDHKLTTLKFYLGLQGDHAKAHSAGEDVAMLLSLLKHMMATSGLGLMELYEMSNQPVEITKMTFGKHKGTKLAELPPSYVSWLLKQENLDENLRRCLEKLN